MNSERIVIIGASLTGATAAAYLREEGFEGAIDLIGAEASRLQPSATVEGVPARTGRLEDQLVKPADYYAEQSITLRLGGRQCRRLKAEGRRALLRRAIAYYRLLVAIGWRNSTSCPLLGGRRASSSLRDGSRTVERIRATARRRRSRRRGRAGLHRVRAAGLAPPRSLGPRWLPSSPCPGPASSAR